MEIKIYRHLESPDRFFNFCKELSLNKDPAVSNMWDNDWPNKSNTLPYLLKNTSRFDGNLGEFFILFNKEEIIACSGVYISEFSDKVAMAGVRTWVKPEYRHLSLNRDYLLVEHKKWCVAKKIKIIALSFNDYNKNIIKIFERNRLGEKNKRLNSRLPKHLFANGIKKVDFLVNIQHTPQWVIYEKLDPNWDFDWNLIRVQ